MARLLSPGVLLAAALLLASCSPITLSMNSIRVPLGGSLKLAQVAFQYGAFANQDKAFLAKLKEHEAVARDLITKGFARGARENGMAGNTLNLSAENPLAGAFLVRIQILNLDPGTKSERYAMPDLASGFGSIRAVALCNGGTLKADAALAEDSTPQSFDAILEDLGYQISSSICSATHESATGLE